MVKALRFFAATFSVIASPELTLTFNKNVLEMPGNDTDAVNDQPYLLIIDRSGFFDVVQYLYTDSVKGRHFTNGDVPRCETDFRAWALLPDLT